MESAPIAVHIAVLAIADDPGRADLATARAAMDRAKAAGHQIVARTIVHNDEAAIHEQLCRWLEQPEIDVVIVASEVDTEAAPAALRPLVTQTLPGFTDLFRWLAFQEIGASAMLSNAEAAQCGSKFVFVLPAAAGAVTAAMDRLLVPQLDHRTKPKNLVMLMPRVRQAHAAATGVPTAISNERTAGGTGLLPKAPAVAKGPVMQNVLRKKPDDPPTRPIDVAGLERQIALSRPPSSDSPTKRVDLAGLLPRVPPGADDILDADDAGAEIELPMVRPVAAPLGRAKHAPEGSIPSVVKPTATPVTPVPVVKPPPAPPPGKWPNKPPQTLPMPMMKSTATPPIPTAVVPPPPPPQAVTPVAPLPVVKPPAQIEEVESDTSEVPTDPLAHPLEAPPSLFPDPPVIPDSLPERRLRARNAAPPTIQLRPGRSSRGKIFALAAVVALLVGTGVGAVLHFVLDMSEPKPIVAQAQVPPPPEVKPDAAPAVAPPPPAETIDAAPEPVEVDVDPTPAPDAAVAPAPHPVVAVRTPPPSKRTPPPAPPPTPAEPAPPPDAAEIKPAEPAPPPPPSEPGCDEVSCVMDKYARPCCARYRPSDPAFQPKASGLPDELDRTMVRSGVERVKPKVIACGEKSTAKGTVKLAVKVDSDGNVKDVSVQDSPDAALGECVATAMRNARFAKTANGGAFTYPFVF